MTSLRPRADAAHTPHPAAQSAHTAVLTVLALLTTVLAVFALFPIWAGSARADNPAPSPDPSQHRAPTIQQPVDPALTQQVNANEPIAPKGTPVAISAGHVDMGPRYLNGTWELMIRDDSSQTPIWRHIDDVVLVVSDAGRQTLPAGHDYDFTGARAGQTVYTVPQQEIPGVVWLGWNTQAPEVAHSARDGVTLSYEGHQGPGQATVFLQSGNFGKPQQLFSSAIDHAQSIFVDLGTHTHANWVFTEPGIHQLRIGARTTLADGTTVTDARQLRFAVGQGTDPQQALAATWDRGHQLSPAENSAPGASDSAGRDGSLQLVAGVVIAVIVVLIIVIVIAVLSARSRRRARAAAYAENAQQADEQNAAGQGTDGRDTGVHGAEGHSSGGQQADGTQTGEDSSSRPGERS
ncbi:choice-of-anchor M domain-containing protein [Devriesea agamarum]|uniref:choice-of-anchor M domain-containing protein n=1 Tax=Devriesea agamarum TaxID=472569 RepID=UPI00071E436A|nr:choice-of-anchor M domain-containing protein [Devriesea agamarum]